MGGLFELPSAVITSADVLRLMSFVSVGTLYDSNPRDVARATVVFCRFALFRTFWPAFFSETMLAYLHRQNPPLTTPPLQSLNDRSSPYLASTYLGTPIFDIKRSGSNNNTAGKPDRHIISSDTSNRQTHHNHHHGRGLFS